VTDEYGLGRNPAPFDAQDWKPETLRAMVKLGVVEPMTWTMPPHHYAQGRTPHCVGFSGLTFWAAAGSASGLIEGLPNELGHELYYECKVEDGEPGEENGSNLRSLAKVLKRRGIIDAYSLTSDVDAIWDWCSDYGVVILGIPWYEGMFEKDAQGVIHPTGILRGGHAICQYAVKQSKDNGLWNTWDDPWGSCWLLDPDMRRLMNERGDALLTVKKVAQFPKLPWELEALSASGELSVSLDDRASIRAAYDAGAMKGFKGGPWDGKFMPGLDVTEHQVKTVLRNLGLPVPAEIDGEWERAATRGWVRDCFPGLMWLDSRWADPLTRYQLLLLVGRKLRGL